MEEKNNNHFGFDSYINKRVRIFYDDGSNKPVASMREGLLVSHDADFIFIKHYNEKQAEFFTSALPKDRVIRIEFLEEKI